MIELSVGLRNALLDGYDRAFAEGATLELLDKAGATIARLKVPEAAWAPAINGTKLLRAPLRDYALATGVVVSYLLKAGDAEERGTVSAIGGDGDMTLTETSLVPGAMVTVSAFTKVA